MLFDCVSENRVLFDCVSENRVLFDRVSENWVLLEYRGGTSYGTHCQASQRRVLIMLTCDSGQSEVKGLIRF